MHHRSQRPSYAHATHEFRPSPPKLKRFSEADRGAFYVVAYRGGEPQCILSTHPTRREALKARRMWQSKGLEGYDEIKLEERY
jgi:hypothetical protein